MASKMQNIKSALKKPQTRLMFFGTFALIGIILVAAWAVFVGKSSKAERELASAVSAPPALQSTSGGAPHQATPEYDRLVAQDNVKIVEEAIKTGSSAIPTPRTGVQDSAIELGPQPITGNPTSTPPPETGPYSQPAQDQQQQQAYEQAVQHRMQAIAQQMEKLQGYWATQPHNSVRVAAEPTGAQAAAQGGVSATVGASAQPTSALQPVPDIRVGDVKYAQLDFGLNTDDPDAINLVMATIHEPGRFNGARLIGQVEVGDQYSKTVGIHFTRMSVVGEAEDRAIDAWAINPTTERPALASHVNNHYLSRGASLFVGSFLEGYSEGLLRGGQNQSVITNGTTISVQTDAFTNEQLMKIGAGNVGRRMADVFAQGASRPKTIRVNAGTDMGVWFIQGSSAGGTTATPSQLDSAARN